ncbi:adenine phosphoribosyltransferase [Desulfovibrio inopinatus]|uniref:adenine phosphoribosyltransferase n=1 Tax=Desulfovibrio inopinatus TaxID=102109 RepID=UPI000402250B|nr:adenine phosphoribosyltransferase [Desulfovibrio inopinatus]
MDLRAYIRDIPDYPKEGIVFFDITPLLGDGPAFRHAIDKMAEQFEAQSPTKIVCAEARGFIFGSALAYTMGIGIVPVRKPGKLPYKTRSVTYDLEYGTDTLCIHEDALKKDDRVLVIDDLLATGGTLQGVLQLIDPFQSDIVGVGVLVELGFLKGQGRLNGYACSSVLTID